MNQTQEAYTFYLVDDATFFSLLLFWRKLGRINEYTSWAMEVDFLVVFSLVIIGDFDNTVTSVRQ